MDDALAAAAALDLPAWDERDRPDVPAYDATPAEVARGDHLRMIHDLYRQSLAEVAAVVDRVAAGGGDVGDARAAVHATGMLQASRQLGSFCGRLCQAVGTHHRVEDAFLYPALRAADTDLGPVLDRLCEEHDVVHDLLERLDAALVGLVRGTVTVDHVKHVFVHFRTLLESHFAYEEAAIGTALGVHRVMV